MQLRGTTILDPKSDEYLQIWMNGFMEACDSLQAAGETVPAGTTGPVGANLIEAAAALRMALADGLGPE